MSKTIDVGGWISIVPDKMYNRWVKENLIKPNQIKINTDAFNEEINAWYDEVFKYVRECLVKKEYIKIKQGTFDGGFCVESNPDSEVVKNWGAPLADEGNKVIQIKEKFGEIVVYFQGLTEEQDKEIEKFAEEVEKKFDCVTRFC